MLIRLGEVCIKIGSGATPKGGKTSYLESGPFALVRSQNIHNHGFEKAGLAFISDAQAAKLDGVSVLPHDVLLNITGDSVARVCQAPNSLGPARVNQHVAIVRPDERYLDARFLRYYLVNHSFQEHMLALASVGATRPALTKSMIESFEIAAPSIEAQREIASILGALDNKIELNRRMSATLEDMARSFYRSWFVDFDPVHAKVAGLSPTFMDEETAALFPDRFGGDGLPEGWETISFVEAIDIISGGTPKTSDPSYWGGDIPWYSVVDAPGPGQIFVIDTAKKITEKGLGKSPARLVPRGTTIISARGTVGKLAMTSQKMTFNQSCYGLRSRRVSGDAFCYFATEREVGDLQSRSHGSVFSTITRQTFEGVNLIDCSDAILEAFADRVDVCLARICSLIEENQTLATLRDTLLPKLMSGELRVGEAREQIEEHA
jgi:type I restriction enzyme S subunit